MKESCEQKLLLETLSGRMILIDVCSFFEGKDDSYLEKFWDRIRVYLKEHGKKVIVPNIVLDEIVSFSECREENPEMADDAVKAMWLVSELLERDLLEPMEGGGGLFSSQTIEHIVEIFRKDSDILLISSDPLLACEIEENIKATPGKHDVSIMRINEKGFLSPLK